MKSKIILWGPLHGQNTHSYIYWALERAFEKLGQEVHWFSDQSHPSSADFDYSNSVFIVDNQGLTDRNCPVEMTVSIFHTMNLRIISILVELKVLLILGLQNISKFSKMMKDILR